MAAPPKHSCRIRRHRRLSLHSLLLLLTSLSPSYSQPMLAELRRTIAMHLDETHRKGLSSGWDITRHVQEELAKDGVYKNYHWAISLLDINEQLDGYKEGDFYYAHPGICNVPKPPDEPCARVGGALRFSYKVEVEPIRECDLMVMWAPKEEEGFKPAVGKLLPPAIRDCIVCAAAPLAVRAAGACIMGKFKAAELTPRALVVFPIGGFGGYDAPYGHYFVHDVTSFTGTHNFPHWMPKDKIYPRKVVVILNPPVPTEDPTTGV